MRIVGLILTTTLASLALSGCAMARYPVMPTLSATDAGAMTCAQLQQELTAVDDVERRIGEIAANGRAADGSSPVLYSTAKSDADRAASARTTTLTEALRAKGCAVPGGN